MNPNRIPHHYNPMPLDMTPANPGRYELSHPIAIPGDGSSNGSEDAPGGAAACAGVMRPTCGTSAAHNSNGAFKLTPHVEPASLVGREAYTRVETPLCAAWAQGRAKHCQ